MTYGEQAEVEQRVLGALLIDSESIDQIRSLLSPDAFLHAPHGKIFNAIIALFEEGERVDQVAVTEKLKKDGDLSECGGVVYLALLAAKVPTAENAIEDTMIMRKMGGLGLN